MPTDVVQVLREDYGRFPRDQTYSLYAEDVYFKDPMNEFRGRDRYRTMIGMINTLFLNCEMALHDIQRHNNQIRTDWTLSWNTPLPWQPRIHIPGWSELTLNEADLIISHIDYWHCSRLDVLKQHVPFIHPASR
ncbi:MAG: DUF2358 domain-containing protein [Leptolyngbyaceae cyanobacterium SL_7_1]|nr:DUF2358 domain-containing protein [Leptolyngbyaceae cyanobacterium SL_7_1]